LHDKRDGVLLLASETRCQSVSISAVGSGGYAGDLKLRRGDFENKDSQKTQFVQVHQSLRHFRALSPSICHRPRRRTIQ
jgi:hypothetical protein